MDWRPIGGAGNLDTGAPANIGQSGSGHYGVSGGADIDDIGIWRRALTSYEAQASYFSGQNHSRSLDASGTGALTLRKSGQDIELIWQAGTLLQSDNVNGPWAPVPGASASYHRVTPRPGAAFYRVRL